MRILRRMAIAAATWLPVAAARSADNAWQPLFNGVNLDGWTPKIRGAELGDNVLHTFRVEDGLLKVRYDQYTNFAGRFGHLFYRDPSPAIVSESNIASSANSVPGAPAGLGATAG